MDLLQYFNFSCPDANYTVAKWVYNKGIADVYVDYTTHLEGKNAKVDFTFENSLIHHTPISV
jgi:hypothetical protein